MKAGKTLQQLATEVDRQARAVQDYRVGTRNMFMGPDARIGLADGMKVLTSGMNVNDLAHSQIATRLSIPQKYYDMMKVNAPRLLAENVNHWLYRNPETRLVRTLDNRVRAFLSASYRPLDNFKLVETVLPKLQKLNARIESAEITERHLYLKAVLAQFEAKIVGDVVQLGLVISNSEVGCGSLKIEPMIYTLRCTNGMIVPEAGVRKYHVGRRNEEDNAQEHYRARTREADDRAFWMKVKDVVDATVSKKGFETVLEQLRGAKDKKIEKPVDAVEVVANKYRMTDSEKDGVLNHLIKDGDMSTYGLVNAVTRTAQDLPDYDRATEFERFGGEILVNLN